MSKIKFEYLMGLMHIFFFWKLGI